jgi:hypothetical protein
VPTEFTEVLLREASGLIGHFLGVPPDWKYADEQLYNMFSAVCDFAVCRDERAFLTSIGDKLAGWIRESKQEPGRVTATILLDVLLNGFFRLDMKNEAASLLNLTSEFQFEFQPSQTGLDELVSPLRLAGVERWLGRNVDSSAFEQAQVSMTALRRSESVRLARIATDYLIALGMGAGSNWSSATLELFGYLPRMPNNFTTCAYYSRLHLEMVEAAVLAVTTTDFRSAAVVHARLGANELRERREFLPSLHKAVIAWGEKDWGKVAR